MATLSIAMLYRFTHALANIYGFIAFGGFVALFLIAFAFTVLYPIVPIILIMIAPFAAVAAVGGSRLLRVAERFFARRKLASAHCPHCDGACAASTSIDAEADSIVPVSVLVCSRCARAFIASGRVLPISIQASSTSSSDHCAD
ncbi:MAG: hypothetical protein EXS10_05185 [Phycisphaerales bacterium]|nr:hypothetical protein [Phycisphaerales bacterium]